MSDGPSAFRPGYRCLVGRPQIPCKAGLGRPRFWPSDSSSGEGQSARDRGSLPPCLRGRGVPAPPLKFKLRPASRGIGGPRASRVPLMRGRDRPLGNPGKLDRATAARVCEVNPKPPGKE